MNTRPAYSLLMLLLLCATAFSQSEPTAKGKEQKFGEVTLETEVKLEPMADFQLPPALKEVYINSNMWMGISSDQALCVSVTNLEAKPGLPLSLDGAIKGNISATTKSLGDSDPKFEIESFKTGSLDAKRAHYEGKIPYQVDVVVAVSGQKLYQIQVIYKPDQAEKAKQVMSSLKISAEAAK